MEGSNLFVKKGRSKRRSHTFWKKIVQEYELSSLSQKDFCNEKGIGLSTFVRWKSLLGNKEEKVSPTFIPVQLLEESVSLRDPSLLPQSPPSSEWVLTFGEKVSLKIPPHFDERVLKRLVSVLKTC